jgi:hypothetical protein
VGIEEQVEQERRVNAFYRRLGLPLFVHKPSINHHTDAWGFLFPPTQSPKGKFPRCCKVPEQQICIHRGAGKALAASALSLWPAQSLGLVSLL